ncbi:SMP-30/gluconolactonase/LRE family protein [Rhodopseudomonas sp. HC1]|uniref:SMP-30/gluconolactonase/LRE family protein n=1 Tax=Rhodopseudomonas infernalis TaxID=2897386 RepID=UPI001EE9845C|nr:SMP-30/gluconolactonase/LRE family protein [Rhodopseudomonas infernalis]MCG6203420.1 SMP-30/gluconolactonase/LRE family protein [Rhodopseudomonas infernalis]
MSLARDIIDRIFFPNRDVHAIPVLDGNLSPNERLDRASVLGEAIEAPDALALDAHGTLYVSSGRTILACGGPDFVERRTFAVFDAEVGALAWSATSGLVAALSGQGVVSLDADGAIVARLTGVAGEPLRCPTALAIGDDGRIYIADGSRHNPASEWHRDLLEKRPPSGRIISCDANLSEARVIANGLDWPAGLVVSHDGRGLLVTESWAHRLSALSLDGGAPRILVKNFAGYPSRISRGSRGDYWLAFFGLRTQLTEFVLREDAFRMRMLEAVEPHLWIGPRLGGAADYREAMQIGRIKKLGIQKPWAPPRSYGLVARIGADGAARESFHSRTSGEVHGITAVLPDPAGRVFAVSKGNGKLIKLPTGPVSE